MATVNGKEYELVTDLARLLRKSGDKILNGESKLSLTTQSLSLLNVAFRRYSETSHGQGETTRGNSKKNVKEQERLQNFRTNAQYLHDFITKTVSLKIIHGTNTMQGAILISRFRNLQVLELKKVPIHMLEGLQKLRSQLQSVIVSRSLQNLQDLFETCGGDMSAPMSWPEMKSVYLSYNGLSKLDGSLRLLPALEVLDLSHNAIHKTENFLEYLTEIVRLNIGYNFMDSIPTFSLSAKSKLKTLVLRNNNLDNLEGIDELVFLEELDVSENCLVDHSCLVVLNGLQKLYMLGLQGNPLSFHRSHRPLTLQHVSSVAGKNEFVLDNKKITVAEKMLTQGSGITASRRPSQEAQNIYTHTRRVLERDGVSRSYNFSDSDNIATSLRVGSPHSKRTKKRKPKVKSKMVESDSGLDQNDDISPLEISTDASSRESSRVPSPVRVVEGQISTKEEIEVIRDHYGANWLQVITAKTNESINTSRSPTASQTEDDIYMNESTAKLHTTDDDIEVIPEPQRPDHIDGLASEVTNVEVKIERENSGEIYSTEPDPDSPFKETKLQSQLSTHGVEWNRDAEEQMEYYGAESEPFIVILSPDNTKQLIITVNQRYIIEKDLNGRVTEMLDLKCLEIMRKTKDSIKTENSEEDRTAPVLKLKFNYIKKDRRERTYVMEDDSNADELESLLQPFIEAKELDNRLHGMLQCLKCSEQFYKKDAGVIEEQTDMKLLKMLHKSEDKIRYKCPKCGSGMVVELDVVQKPKSRQTTPKGSHQSTPKGSRQSTPKGSYTSVSSFTNAMTTEKISPIKSTVKDEDVMEPDKIPKSEKMNNLAVEDNESDEQQTTNMTGKDLFPSFKSSIGTAMSRSDGFCSVQNEDFQRRSSTSTVTTPTENTAFQRNDSWSDVNNALANKQLNKRRSADSDITILTNTSESSVTVISESSIETISDLEQDEQNYTLTKENEFSQKLSLPFRTSNQTIPENTKGEYGSPNKHLTLNGITEETGEVTPIGSPLSTSVCSSMVSSVYENSMNVESRENLCVDDGVTENGRTNVHDDAENNNDEYKSIYDSHNDNDSVDIYDAGVDNGTKNLSSTNSKTLDSLDNSTIQTGTSPLVHSVASSDGVVVLESENLNSDKADSMETSINSTNLTNSILEASCEEIDFTKIDHRVKLFLMMNVIEDSDEFNCAIECDIMQYMNTEEFKGTLIMCTDKIIILKVLSEDTSTESLEDSLICIENQPMTELQYVDIGLGYQSFRFEFGTDCASYTFIVRDEGRCKQFISLVTELVQSTAFSEHSKLEGISKYNATTVENLQSSLSPWKQVEEEEAIDIVKYLMCYLVKESDTDESITEPISIVVTYTDMFLVKENHQWPIPRLQAPLNDEVKGQQFYVKDSQKINNIATFECCEEDPTQVKVTFFNEESQEEVSWHIIMVTLKGVQSLVNAIREPWESEFGVNLDISSVSLNDM